MQLAVHGAVSATVCSPAVCRGLWAHFCPFEDRLSISFVLLLYHGDGCSFTGAARGSTTAAPRALLEGPKPCAGICLPPWPWHMWGQAFPASHACRFTRDSLATWGDGALRTRRELNAVLDHLLCLVSFLLGTQPIWGIFFQCLMPLTDSAWRGWESQDGAYWGGDLRTGLLCCAGSAARTHMHSPSPLLEQR